MRFLCYRKVQLWIRTVLEALARDLPTCMIPWTWPRQALKRGLALEPEVSSQIRKTNSRLRKLLLRQLQMGLLPHPQSLSRPSRRKSLWPHRHLLQLTLPPQLRRLTGAWSNWLQTSSPTRRLPLWTNSLTSWIRFARRSTLKCPVSAL